MNTSFTSQNLDFFIVAHIREKNFAHTLYRLLAKYKSIQYCKIALIHNNANPNSTHNLVAPDSRYVPIYSSVYSFITNYMLPRSTYARK